MDGTAPTILPLDLNHVLGTAAAPFSVDVRPADQISADDRMLSGGRIGCGTSTRSVDVAHILCFKVEMITALIAYTAAETILRLFRDPPFG